MASLTIRNIEDPLKARLGVQAAIGRSLGAAFATRNVGDFEGCGVEVINPWDDAA